MDEARRLYDGFVTGKAKLLSVKLDDAPAPELLSVCNTLAFAIAVPPRSSRVLHASSDERPAGAGKLGPRPLLE